MASEKTGLSGLKGLTFPGLVHDGYFQGKRVDGRWRRSVTPFRTDPKALARLHEYVRQHRIK